MAIGNEFILRIPMKTLLSLTDPVDRDVFLAAYSFMNNGAGECRASHRAIAKRSTHSRRTIDRAMPRLVKKGYFKVGRTDPVRGGYVNVYVLSGSPMPTKTPKVGHPVAKVGHGGGQKLLKKEYKKRRTFFNTPKSTSSYKPASPKPNPNADPTKDDFDLYLGLAEKITDKHKGRRA